jgi:hypothetical protein
MTQIGLFEGRARRDKGLAKVSEGFGWWVQSSKTAGSSLSDTRPASAQAPTGESFVSIA